MSANPRQLLVPSKLAPPQPRATWVRRERLLPPADASPAPRLTLIVAPAGFGKTTVAAQWLAQPAGGAPGQAAPVAWLTLDEHDQDALRFLAYLAGAIERAAPASLATTRGLLRAPEPPPPSAILQTLLVELSALATGLTLVLDDYALVTAQAVHQLVDYLLRNLPPACRLVILSRVDPPLPLARLRAERRLRELRAADLRFTPAEAEAMVAGMLGPAAGPELAAELHRQTEGWPIALQLAALAHQEAGGRGATTRQAAGQIAEYLAEEVLARQPAAVDAALVALAVPERFCAGLCAALLDTPDDLLGAEALLERLTRSNLLLVPLEDGWYRFHNLFRDHLLRRLRLTRGREGARALELRAARWLEEAGLAEEGLRLYLAAGAEDAAGSLVERLLFRELGRETAGGPPRTWLGLLPAGLAARRPGLTLIEARLAVVQMDVAAAAASIARVDALLAAPEAAGQEPPWPSFLGDLEVLRGTLDYWQGQPGAAIEALSAGLRRGAVPALATSGLLFLGRAYVSAGRYEEGLRLMDDPAATGIAMNAGMRHTALCMMHELAGRAEPFYREALLLGETLAAQGVGGSWAAFASSYIGRATYERSDLDAARGHFAEVRARKYETNAYNYIGCLIGLAMIALAQGAPDEAALYEREAQAFAAEVGGLFLGNEALGCSVHLAVARGDLAQALAAAEQIAPDPQLGTRAWYAAPPPQLSQARALIAAGGPGLARAEALLDDLLAQVEPMHNMRPVVCALATTATLRRAQGDPEGALAAVGRAVELAAPLGLVRTLVDCGPPLVPLLRALAARGAAPDYLEGLLGRLEAAPPGQSRPPPAAAPPALPELLTRREAEILALLARRWSDKEIAEGLGIAANTVRKHTGAIYGKLGAGSRREAVELARELGLLPAES